MIIKNLKERFRAVHASIIFNNKYTHTQNLSIYFTVHPLRISKLLKKGQSCFRVPRSKFFFLPKKKLLKTTTMMKLCWFQRQRVEYEFFLHQADRISFLLISSIQHDFFFLLIVKKSFDVISLIYKMKEDEKKEKKIEWINFFADEHFLSSPLSPFFSAAGCVWICRIEIENFSFTACANGSKKLFSSALVRLNLT